MLSFICGGLQQRADSSAVSLDRDVYMPFPSPRQVSTSSSAFGIDCRAHKVHVQFVRDICLPQCMLASLCGRACFGVIVSGF